MQKKGAILHPIVERSSIPVEKWALPLITTTTTIKERRAWKLLMVANCVSRYGDLRLPLQLCIFGVIEEDRRENFFLHCTKSFAWEVHDDSLISSLPVNADQTAAASSSSCNAPSKAFRLLRVYCDPYHWLCGSFQKAIKACLDG